MGSAPSHYEDKINAVLKRVSAELHGIIPEMQEIELNRINLDCEHIYVRIFLREPNDEETKLP